MSVEDKASEFATNLGDFAFPRIVVGCQYQGHGVSVLANRAAYLYFVLRSVCLSLRCYAGDELIHVLARVAGQGHQDQGGSSSKHVSSPVWVGVAQWG